MCFIESTFDGGKYSCAHLSHVEEGQWWPQDRHEDRLDIRVTVGISLGCKLHDNIMIPPPACSSILLHVTFRHHRGVHMNRSSLKNKSEMLTYCIDANKIRYDFSVLVVANGV